MAFPERKPRKVPGRDNVGGRGGPGRGSRTPGFVWVSGATSCVAGAPGVRPHPTPGSHGPWAPPPAAVCFPEGPGGPGSVGEEGDPGGD